MSSKDRLFLKLAIFACLLSVITTIGIHSGIFDFSQITEDERQLLFQNTFYLFYKFWIIFHCVLVLFSMYGICMLLSNRSKGFSCMGFVFFGVFAFAEIFRQMYVLFYVNAIRKNYIIESMGKDELIEFAITSAGLMGNALFGLFILCFAIGNILYGIAIWNDDRFDKVLSLLLIIWGLGCLLVFANEFWEIKQVSLLLKYFSQFYQPIIRLLIGIWMIYSIKPLLRNE